MLIIQTSSKYVNEKEYICSVIFNEFLGVDYQLEFLDIPHTIIKMNNTNIIMPDILFSKTENEWLTYESLPELPLSRWSFNKTIDLPIIYGNLKYISEPNSADKMFLPIDILGSTFFMLTRYEEYVKNIRDQYGRFSSKDSLAFLENFLERPIVNEYVEILWESMHMMFSGLKRKKHEFEICVSHDVDKPFEYLFLSPCGVFKRAASDVVKRTSIKKSISTLKKWFDVRNGNCEQDSFYTFNKFMEISEGLNIQSSFYFFGTTSPGKKDCDYSLDKPQIRKLMKTIHGRGHKIGLHGSYSSYNNFPKIREEFIKLREVCDIENIKQDVWGSRQHNLRWDVPVTWQNLNDIGMDYDTTLTYADNIGFRCGCCYEYTVYNMLKRKKLQLKERPLLVMDCTLTSKKYMNLGYSEEALAKANILKKKCRLYGGVFSLLWHNNYLITDEQVSFYRDLLK